MAAYIERLKSPIGEALWAAGPPSGQILGALGLAVVLTVVLSLADASFGPPWYTLGLIGLLLTGVVSVIDRDGWRIREAFAYLALQQRARWRQADVPEGTEEVQAWLDDPANIGASNFERATMLFNADRWDDADRLLAQTVPRDDQERAVLIRLRSTVAAQPSGEIDQAALRDAISSLPEAEGRYQLLSAIWSQAWLDVTAGRPWRTRFAEAVRDLGPYDLPVWARVSLALEQLTAPIACVAALLIAAGLSWYSTL
jgi:hypothetical protein